MISTDMWAFWFLAVLTALEIEPMAVDAKRHSIACAGLELLSRLPQFPKQSYRPATFAML